MKISTQKYLLLIIIGSICFSACKKFVEIPPPKNQLVSNTVFADSLGATAAMNGIYVNMMQYFGSSFSNGAVTLYTGLSGDELITTTNNSDELEFYNNSITVDNGINQQLWPTAYKIIYTTNACLEGIKGSDKLSTKLKNSLTGEALVIRSFIYFNLINLYGDVPYVTTTDYNITRLAARVAVNDIYSQLVSDLKTAQSNLSNQQSAVNTRASYDAATALLAKIYLYRKSYSEAITEANKVINSGTYSLETDLNKVFLKTSTETIWSLAPVQPNVQTNEGLLFAPTSSTVVPKYIITNSLFNSFETVDARKSKWIGVNTVGGKSYPYPYKYKKGRSSEPVTENYTVTRLSELYLINAEAKANNSDIQGALNDLNVVRQRAGLSDYVSTDKQSIVSAIITERQHEMFCEWGNRWYDLNRLSLSDSILGRSKLNWKSTSKLYPIPQSEISANPMLSQNAGY